MLVSDDQRATFMRSSSLNQQTVTLWVQLWLYSVGIGVLAAVTGIVPAAEVSTHYYLTLLFPVTMGHYWFLTAYLFLYILLPFVGMGLRRMTKQQFQVALVPLPLPLPVGICCAAFRWKKMGRLVIVLVSMCILQAVAYTLRDLGIQPENPF